MSDTTLHKIATTLGLSISTVSRALKGHPDISVQTRKKVLAAAAKLNYSPNPNTVYNAIRSSAFKLFSKFFTYGQSVSRKRRL